MRKSSGLRGPLQGRKLLFWLLAALLVCLKYLLYGFQYYPLLDDYIQYWAYPHLGAGAVFTQIGTLATRPLAGLADVYVWGSFWPNMGIALAIITCLHILSAYFFCETLEFCRVPCGTIFLAVYLFLPMGFEAAYWISASSRIIVGLFFVSLSLFFLVRHIQMGRRWCYFIFSILQLISFCFYEQVIIVGFIMSIFVLASNRQRAGSYIAPFVNLVLIGLYYLLFSRTGAFADRGTILTGQALVSQLTFLAGEFRDLWYSGLWELTKNGFWRGIALLWQNPVYLIAVVLTICVFVPLGTRQKEQRYGRSYLLAVLLLILPFLIFLVQKDSILPYRNAYPAIMGLAIAAQAVFDGIFSNRAIRGGIAFCLLFIFMCANVSELTDYKSNTEIDAVICRNVGASLSSDVLAGEREAILVGTRWRYAPQNASHREHIYSLTQSDWALTGGLRYYTGSWIKLVTPAPEVTQQMLDSDAQILALQYDFSVQVVRP